MHVVILIADILGNLKTISFFSYVLPRNDLGPGYAFMTYRNNQWSLKTRLDGIAECPEVSLSFRGIRMLNASKYDPGSASFKLCSSFHIVHNLLLFRYCHYEW